VPMADMDPGLRRESEKGRTTPTQLSASEC
jgi:hypothetical protein